MEGQVTGCHRALPLVLPVKLGAPKGVAAGCCGSWRFFWGVFCCLGELQGRLPHRSPWLKCCCLLSQPCLCPIPSSQLPARGSRQQLSPRGCSWVSARAFLVSPELPENWTDTRETLLEGMLFSLKYMGMTLVEQPKGEELSAAAVKRIVATVSVPCWPCSPCSSGEPHWEQF